MPIDYSVFATVKGGLPKGRPRVLVEHAKDVAADAAMLKAYKKVDDRDDKVCRVTGKTLVANHGNLKLALARHHLDEQSTAKDRKHDPDNILTVSEYVHKFMQAHALIPVDKRGNETTSVRRIWGYAWNRRLVAPNKEPFRLRPEVRADR